MPAGEAAPMISLDRPAWSPPPVEERNLLPLPPAPLPSESSFYLEYGWCLDAFPTVREVSRRLRDELSRPGEELEGWQRVEVAINVFLLSCAVADAVDDYTAGERYDLAPAAVPGLQVLTGAVE